MALRLVIGGGIVVHAACALIVGASAGTEEAAAGAPEPTKGILPIPDYSGDVWTRPFLLGDLDGGRTSLANKGVQFNVDFTQIAQSVVDGGRDTDTRYGGNLDYNLLLDLQKMGVMPGALIKFRAESRYGKNVNRAAGPILPVNIDSFFPLTSPSDDEVPIALTNLVYTQYLSETFGVFAGKFDTLDGDLTEFASGRGTSQFFNSNLVFSTVAALLTPYSTLGGGVVWAPTPDIVISSVVFSAADSSTTSGFDTLGDGWVWSSSASVQYRLWELPGGVSVSGMYSWDNDFADVNKHFVFEPGEGIVRATTDTSWSVFANGWQYLFAEGAADKPLDLANGKQDLEGLGLFGRIGFSDDDTNPVELSLNAGLGWRGFIPSRDEDALGVGYFFQSLRTGRIAGLLGVGDETQGVEGYYNLAITPAAHLTFDVQWVENPRPATDAAWILGLRLRLLF